MDSNLHPGVAQLLSYFAFDHLPPHLQVISKQFHDLAWDMVERLPSSPELTAGLRKLLEAKDCMVRANLPHPHTHTADLRECDIATQEPA